MATAGQAEHAAERAADQTDARVRDVDRWIRWGIALVLGVVLGLALLMLGLFGDLRGEIAAGQVEIEAEISNVREELGAEVASVREELGAVITSLRNEIRQFVSSAADETAESGGN